MDDNKELTHNQKRVIPYLLTAPSIEEGCKRARVSKAAVYQWLKDQNFRQELKRQRNAIIEQALDGLKANLAEASKTLVSHLKSTRENSIRAAERIIEFTQKALELENASKHWKLDSCSNQEPVDECTRTAIRTTRTAHDS